MLHDHDVWLRVTGQPKFSFVDDDYQLVYTWLRVLWDHQSYAPAQFVDFIQDDHLQNLVIDIESMQLNESTSEGEIDDYIQLIMNVAPLTKRIGETEQALQEARRLGDNDRVRQLVIEYIKLQQQKQSQKQA